jgi:hypothetical protein
MGCGSSSLKGDQPTGLTGGDDAPQPIRKVKTNFSTVDYDAGTSASKKRRMTEYAPEDTIRNRSEASGAAPGSRDGGGPSAGGVGGVGGVGDGEKVELEPYHTRESKDFDVRDVGYPHENPRVSGQHERVNENGEGLGSDPTSGAAKDEFARANDPLKHAGGEGGLAPPEDEADKKRKGSWLDRLKESRRQEISEEDMVKVSH